MMINEKQNRERRKKDEDIRQKKSKWEWRKVDEEKALYDVSV